MQSKEISQGVFSPSFIFNLKNKDEQAFIALYDQFAPCLFTFISKILPNKKSAEQALQNTFTQAISRVQFFNTKTDDLQTWMVNLARTEAIEMLVNVQADQSSLASTLMCNNTFSLNVSSISSILIPPLRCNTTASFSSKPIMVDSSPTTASPPSNM